MIGNKNWLVLAPIAALAIMLAFWGFSECGRVECQSENILMRLQNSLNLVRGNGNFSFGRHPWQLVIAQYLIPGVAIVAGAKLFLWNLRRDMRIALARRTRDHTIVCGLGDTGRSIVENLRAAGERVVAIDLENETPHAALCEHINVPVIKGDAAHAKTLAIAGFSRARAIVASCGNDARNLEIALRANESLRNQKARTKVQVLAEIRSHWMLDTICNNERASLSSANMEFKPFNVNETAARLLYRSPAFQHRSKFSVHNPHLLVIGLGSMGSEIVSHGIRTAFASPTERVRFTLIDQHGAKAGDVLFSRFPNIGDLADLEFVEFRVGTDRASCSKLDSILQAGGLTGVIVALPDDNLNLFAGLHVRNQLDRLAMLATPVFTRLRHNKKLGEFAGGAEQLGPFHERFTAFGDLSYLTSRSVLFDGALDDLARAYHDLYFNEPAAGRAENGPAHVAWEHLPELYKQSNRRLADHVGVKLRATGLRLQRAHPASLLELTQTEVEHLAALEHWRWTVELRMMGWRAGPLRNEIRRIHPALVDWEELPEEMREQNRIAARRLPQLLARQGFEIRRERFISAVGKDAATAKAALNAMDLAQSREHAIVVVDPEDVASREIARHAVGTEYATVWLLASRALFEVGSRDPSRLGRESREVWGIAESWMDEQEFQVAKSNADKCFSAALA
jgi:hypothetical protein